MPSKRHLVKEFLRLVEMNELKDFKCTKVKVKLPCGSRVVMTIDFKEEKKVLKLVKSG